MINDSLVQWYMLIREFNLNANSHQMHGDVYNIIIDTKKKKKTENKMRNKIINKQQLDFKIL